MAKRPIFISTNNFNEPIIEKEIEFEWVKGLSFQQKQKRVELFHECIKTEYNDAKILEVSTKSKDELGIKLSAFNLRIKYKNINTTIESVYQSSKIYKNNRNNKDLIFKSSQTAKKESIKYRLEEIIGFKFEDIEFENEPMGMFYDWLYIKGLMQNSKYFKEIVKYNIFTDIEFNPKKSYNCQARALAIFKTLYISKKINEIMKDVESYKEYYKSIFKTNKQINLF